MSTDDHGYDDAEDLRVFIEDHHTPDRNGYYGLLITRPLICENLGFDIEQLDQAEERLQRRKILMRTDMNMTDGADQVYKYQVRRRGATPFPWGRTADIRARRGLS